MSLLGQYIFLRLLAKFAFAYFSVSLAFILYSTIMFLRALSVSILFLRKSFTLVRAITVIGADVALLTFPRANRRVSHLKPLPSGPEASNVSLLELCAHPRECGSEPGNVGSARDLMPLE